MRIFKYQLSISEKQTISLPMGARILRVDSVDGKFFLWAMVNKSPDHPQEERFLECYKTGQPIETDTQRLTYIGFCTLFIGQELCLYFFENNKP